MSICVHVMLCARPSKAVDLVNPDMACFATEYASELGRGTCAAKEPLLIMRPGRTLVLSTLNRVICI